MAEDLQLKMYISARQEALDAGLQKAEAKIKETTDRINRAQGGSGGGIGGSIKGIGQAFEPVEKLGKIFTVVEASASAIKGISAGIKGDWDGVGEALKELPFGIGRLSAAAMDFKAEITGAKKELEALNEQAKRQDAESAFRQKGNAAFRNALDRATGAAQSEQRQAQLAGARNNADRARMSLGFDLEDMRKNLADSLKEMEKMGMGPQSNAARMLTAQAEAAMSAREQRGQMDIVDAMEKDNAAIREQWDKEAKEEQRQQERMADLRGRAAIAELEAQGKTHEAKLAAIEENYREQIAKATEGERALLEQLKASEMAQEQQAEAKRQHEKTMTARGKEFDMVKQAQDKAEQIINQRIAGIQSQVLSPTDAGFMVGGGGTDRGDEIAQEQLKVQEEQVRILNDMRREQYRRQKFVEVGF